MNRAALFSRASDEWATPHNLYASLDAEFHFSLDAAATASNTKCARWYGPGGVSEDALSLAWTNDAGRPCAVWLNPPYSRAREFMARAAHEAIVTGSTIVCLVPSRTDTRWWHDYVWDAAKHRTRPGVSIRFIRGRLIFGGASAGAPFPSVIVVFSPEGGGA